MNVYKTSSSRRTGGMVKGLRQGDRLKSRCSEKQKWGNCSWFCSKRKEAQSESEGEKIEIGSVLDSISL